MKVRNILISLLFVLVSVCTLCACDNKVSLTVIVNGGKVICENHENITSNTTYKFEKGENVTLNAVANPGYEFVAWFSSETMYADSAQTSFLIKEDRILIARFKKIVYTISYNLNGGNVNGETSLENTLISVGDPVLLPNPTQDGKRFAGWYISGTDELFNETTFSTLGNKSLTARYAEGRAVSFDLNGGNIGGNTNAVEKTLFLNDNFGITNPVKAGYRFIGWSVNGLAYNGTTLTVDADTTFKAEFLKEYTMSFKTETGAATLIADKKVCVGDSVALEELTKDGFRFNGWSYGGEVYSDTIEIVNEANYEMKSDYSQEFTLSFFTGETEMSNATDTVESMKVYAGDKMDNLPIPTRTSSINKMLPGSNIQSVNEVIPAFRCWSFKNTEITDETVYNYGQNITLIARWDTYMVGVDLNQSVTIKGIPDGVITFFEIKGDQKLADVMPYRGKNDQGINSVNYIVYQNCQMQGFSGTESRDAYLDSTVFTKTFSEVIADFEIANDTFFEQFECAADGTPVMEEGYPKVTYGYNLWLYAKYWNQL